MGERRIKKREYYYEKSLDAGLCICYDMQANGRSEGFFFMPKIDSLSRLSHKFEKKRGGSCAR